MKRSLSVFLVFIAMSVAFCTHAVASGRRLPVKEMDEIEKTAVILDYWGLDGPNRSEDRLFLHRPSVYRNHTAVPLSRKDFLRKLTELRVKRDTIVITMAVTVDPIPDPSFDEAVRFFQRCGFHRVMILSGEGSSPKGSPGPLILRETAVRQ
jgi:hypothetical protein